MRDLFDVSGKLALVTGSTRGIGRTMAEGLVQHGCSVAVNGRDPDKVDAVCSELGGVAEAGARAVPAGFDVTDPAAVAEAVANLERDVAPIDILVNNAGIQIRRPVVDFGDDDWRAIVDTNLSSAFYAARAVARGMIDRGIGRIVNVCSVQSKLARAGIVPYTATKGGLLMLTQGLCADLAPFGITVNAIGPGYLDTELNAALVNDPEFSAWVEKRAPAGRWGRPEDLVGTLIYLASAASSYVNGQIIYVDGGMTSVV